VELRGPVLLYDGTCGFCAASVSFILRHERGNTLRFATLDGSVGSEIRLRHQDLAAIDSMVWVEPPSDGQPERALVRSAAALRVARYLGGAWRLALLTRLLPTRLRDVVYDWVARHRHQIAAPSDCLVPSPAQRARFLDLQLPLSAARPK
jgi:predicted DCC family thiol-disulfide oxidoreductase YuxK